MLKHLKHHWKRAASGLIALVMAAGLLPGTSLAAETAATPKIQAEAAYAPTGNFELDRKSTRLNSSHKHRARMPSSA